MGTCLPSPCTPNIAQFGSRTVSLGRFGSFFANELIGEPYGLRYEIKDKQLICVPPLGMEDLGKLHPEPRSCTISHTCTEDTDANNELINDGEFVQPLTSEEIEALKQSGVHASVRPNTL